MSNRYDNPSSGEWFKQLGKWNLWIIPSMFAIILLAVSQLNFLIFHTLAELFAIIISVLMFTVAWVTYDLSKNKILIFLACGYVWIGVLDLMHALSYKGVNILVSDNGNIATQLWVGTRYFESILLLLASTIAFKSFNKNTLFVLFGVIALSIAFLIFKGYFPVAFIEGEGLSSFKIYSEYIIDSILLLALFSLFHFRNNINSQEKILITLSIFFTICAELAFTFYVDLYGFSNFVGHIFKLYSFWFLFYAVIITNLKAPYAALNKSKEELKLALAEAQRANRAKSEFLANMSHDFRTPLNAILGFSDMMVQKVLGPVGNERYEEYLKDIHNSGSLLISLVNDILDVSKIESGKYKINEKPLNIADMVNQSIRQVSQMAKDGEVEIKINIPKNTPNLLSDKRVIIQILNNLLSNSIKFTPAKGTITINVILNVDDSLVISIVDTGIGMTDEEIERVIHPFEQANSLSISKHFGTGLGLYLCKNFMDLFEGKIDITSVVGEGTTVLLLFPKKRTHFQS